MDMLSSSQRWVAKRLMKFAGIEGTASGLLTLLEPWDFPVSIVAGHYFLLYDSEADRLVPVVSSAASGAFVGEAEQDLVARVGDLPSSSLRIALRLLHAFPNRGWRIAIAIDDHQFQRVQSRAPTGPRAEELRSAYYKQHGIPAELQEVIAESGFSVADVVVDNSDPARKHSVLPRTTKLFSEATHRNRFTDRRRKWLLKHPGFTGAQAFFEDGLLYFRPLDSGERVCLVGADGRAYCSGAMIEFLFDLASRGAKGILMFIPNDCRDDVDLAIEAFMSLETDVIEVATVWPKVGQCIHDVTCYSAVPPHD
jgi:hypothetical protein